MNFNDEQCTFEGHDFQPSGMYLVKVVDVRVEQLTFRREVVAGPEGEPQHRTPEVQVCKKCGVLRIPVET